MYPQGSPGSIRNQVGYSLNSVREAVDAGDVLAVGNHLAFLKALCAPKMTLDQRASIQVPPLPEGRDRDGSAARRYFMDCMRMLEALLVILSEGGLYSWNEPAPGDASGLRLPEEDSGVEV